jgi:hypothetical protein
VIRSVVRLVLAKSSDKALTLLGFLSIAEGSAIDLGVSFADDVWACELSQ